MASQALLKNLILCKLNNWDNLDRIWQFRIYTTKSGKPFKVFVRLLVAIILSLTPPGQSEQKKQIWEWRGVWVNLEKACSKIGSTTDTPQIIASASQFIKILHSMIFLILS